LFRSPSGLSRILRGFFCLKSPKVSPQVGYSECEIYQKVGEELTGISLGEGKGINLSPNDGYGEIAFHFIRVLPLERFPGNTEEI
jgi:FKBP-type peptidyl-prolyl cis-trans isomerase 2